MGNRKLGIIVMSLILLITLSGCMTERTVAITPRLPVYSPMRPQRPHLVEVDDGLQLPVPVLQNMILLQGYARELEEYADGWEQFYESLRGEVEHEGIQNK